MLSLLNRGLNLRPSCKADANNMSFLSGNLGGHPLHSQGRPTFLANHTCQTASLTLHTLSKVNSNLQRDHTDFQKLASVTAPHLQSRAACKECPRSPVWPTHPGDSGWQKVPLASACLFKESCDVVTSCVDQIFTHQGECTF